MTIRKTAALLALTLILLQPVKAAKGFAIIIDQKSLNEAKSEVEAYAKSIKDVNKMKVYTIVDRFQDEPEFSQREVKRTLRPFL